MLRQLALGLFLSLFCAPAFAIEEVPDEAPEEDAYVPHKFSIALKAAYADFEDSRSINDTGNAGVRVGFALNPWAELQFGVDYMKAHVDVKSNDSTVRDDVGDLRMVPTYADFRVNITCIDPWIKWPLDWVYPEAILGVGYMHLRLNEDSDFSGDINYHSGALLRGGLAMRFGKPQSRFSFAVELIYTWVVNDLRIEENPATNNFPSRLNLDYLEVGASLTWRF